MTAAEQYAAGMAALIAGREAQMLDTCRVARPEQREQTPVLDAGGNVTDAPDPVVYDGPCVLARFRSSGARATVPPTVSDASGEPEPRTLKVPHRADLRPGDLVTLTGCAFAPENVGETFVVMHRDPITYSTFQSFFVRGSSWRSTDSGTSPEPGSS